MRILNMMTAAALAVGLPVGAASVQAASVADFYKGKTLNIVVGHQPGTGFDLYARALAPYMSKHMPGNPKVVVQNMNGASGLVSLNWLTNKAPKDGSVMATMVFTAPFEPLLGAGKGKFEAAKLTWIGSMDSSVAVCGVARKAKINNFDELFKKELRIGATGRTGPFRTTPTALKRLLGIKLNIVTGYKGSVAVRQAILRGEVDGACGPSMSAVRVAFKELTKRGDFKIILQASKITDPALKGVPHVYSYAKNDDDKKVFDLIFGIQRLGRMFVAPPGMPADRANALRKAFTAAVKDPDLVAQAKKSNLSLNFRSAEEIAQIVKETYATPKNLVERARKATAK